MKKIKVRTISQIIILEIIVFLAFAYQQYGIEQASPTQKSEGRSFGNRGFQGSYPTLYNTIII